MAERQVGHKVSVHHVQVLQKIIHRHTSDTLEPSTHQIIGTVVQQPLRFIVQLGQVGVQDRRPDFRV